MEGLPSDPVRRWRPRGGRVGVSLERLVLWRHGESDYNSARRMQGQCDSRLTATGLGQARRAARFLSGLKPEVLVA
ncbi:MAG: histidine phosphatase family protein, partial [Pseudonocardiaceae bacterium]